MKRAFRLFDQDDSGSISVENLKKIASELMPGQTNPGEIRKMIEIGDLNGDGEVDREEFMEIMRKA